MSDELIPVRLHFQDLDEQVMQMTLFDVEKAWLTQRFTMPYDEENEDYAGTYEVVGLQEVEAGGCGKPRYIISAALELGKLV